MSREDYFRELFYGALAIHRQNYSVSSDRIEKAIVAIQDEYAPKKSNSCRISKKLDYNDPAYRCAYLHKYAGCHAALVNFVLQICIPLRVFEELFLNKTTVRICCIGGGPGTDVIGLSSMFYSNFGTKSFLFTVIDCMLEWQKAYDSVCAALQCDCFGHFMKSRVRTSYIQANMLTSLSRPVEESICSSNLVTMVKFVSAAESETTPRMLQDIFTLMKPGAAVLFVDNAGGGFYELVSKAASHCGLVTQSKVFRALKFENEAHKRKMYGFFSLSTTTVAVKMWRKPSSSILNGPETRLPRYVDCSIDIKENGQNIQKKRRRRRRNRGNSKNCTGAVVSNANQKSNESSVGLMETNSEFVIKTTCHTANNSHNQTSALKTKDSLTTTQMKKSRAFASDVRCNPMNSLHSQALVSKTTNSPIVSEVRRHYTVSSEAKNDQNVSRKSSLNKESVGNVGKEYKSDGCQIISGVSQNQTVCNTSNSDSGDFGIQHDFSGSSNSHLYDSHRSKHKKKNKNTTGCCIVL